MSLTPKLQKVVEVLGIQDPENWFVEDYSYLSGWKYNPQTDKVSYYLTENQIFSTLQREPVYSGDHFSDEKPGTRIELGDNIVCFLETESKCVLVFNADEEVKSRAWWLWTGQKYSTDWDNAKWIEI